jgi:uncharacterized membrane protein YfcA
MIEILPDITLPVLLLALASAALAGVVKGMVGFAMPMILISALSSVMPPEMALAGLIGPTLVSNGVQALGQGASAAGASIKRFRVYLGVVLVMILLSAQLVAVMPANLLLLGIGGPIVLFALLQLAGWELHLAPHQKRIAEPLIGAIAGFIGGMSGVWGPPTVAYLTAIKTEKLEQIRVQGVVYGLGAVMLTVAHIGSGVLNARSVWLSLALIPPAMLGMWIGMRWQKKIDQRAFKRWTLFVLLIAGLNLLRRALT